MTLDPSFTISMNRQSADQHSFPAFGTCFLLLTGFGGYAELRVKMSSLHLHGWPVLIAHVGVERWTQLTAAGLVPPATLGLRTARTGGLEQRTTADAGFQAAVLAWFRAVAQNLGLGFGCRFKAVVKPKSQNSNHRHPKSFRSRICGGSKTSQIPLPSPVAFGE